MSRLRLLAVGVLALVMALPGTVLAAAVPVSGTVTAPEGVSVAGVEIAILVQGSDQILATTTDASGAWALQVDAEAGSVLEINATAPTTTTEPDADGCVISSTASGQVEVTLADLAPAPITVPLDRMLTNETCASTTAPATEKPATEKPAKTPPFTGTKTPPVTGAKTPPSTDASGGLGDGRAGPSLAVVVGLLAVLSAVSLVVTRRRHTRRLARRPVRTTRRRY